MTTDEYTEKQWYKNHAKQHNLTVAYWHFTGRVLDCVIAGMFLFLVVLILSY